MATAARIFGVLIAIAGLAYVAVAVYVFLNIDRTAGLLDWAKATEYKEFGHRTIGEWKQGAWFNASVFFGVGVAATVCGIGLATLKEWARRSWLVVSGLLVLFVLVVAAYTGGEWMHYEDLLLFALPSFVLLRRRFGAEERAI